MNSRLVTLLDTFKLKDKTFEGKITTKNLNPDYKNVNKILEKERLKAHNFIKKALDIK